MKLEKSATSLRVFPTGFDFFFFFLFVFFFFGHLLLAGHQLLEVHQIKGTVRVEVSFVKYRTGGGPQVSNEEPLWWTEKSVCLFWA